MTKDDVPRAMRDQIFGKFIGNRPTTDNYWYRETHNIPFDSRQYFHYVDSKMPVGEPNQGNFSSKMPPGPRGQGKQQRISYRNRDGNSQEEKGLVMATSIYLDEIPRQLQRILNLARELVPQIILSDQPLLLITPQM